MKSEEELKNVLVENLGLPFGQAFKFSRNWFEKYHKHKETTSINSQKESKNVGGSTVKINTKDGSWGSKRASRNQTEESKSFNTTDEIQHLAEDREKSAKLTLDKDDISEVQNGNRNLSIKTLMIEEGVVIQDRPSNDTEEPVTSQWLKSKQDAGEQKTCENTKTDARFEVFKEVSLCGPLPHGSLLLRFFDRRHLDFWDFNSTVPVGVVKLKFKVNCFFYRACVEVEITVNNLYFGLERVVPGVVDVL
nr:uncharacterized protein LOC131793009 [Pocillopora verrucosa]